MVRTAETLSHSLKALAEREEAFAKVIDTYGHPEPRASEPGVETLLRTIVGQQVSVAVDVEQAGGKVRPAARP